MNSIRFRGAAALSLTLALGLGAIPVFAGDEPVVKEKRVIVINDNGKVYVNEDGDGDAVAGVKRGYIGVSLVELSDGLRSYFGVDSGDGVLVSEAGKGSPAEKAGIRAGDVIVAVNGTSVDSSRAVGEIVRELKKGDTAKVDVRRKGTAQQFLVTVDEREMKPFEVMINRHGMPGMADGQMKELDIDAGTLGALGSLENLHEYFETPEWKAKMQSIGNCDQFEKKIDDLEKRLKELEKQLPKK